MINPFQMEPWHCPINREPDGEGKGTNTEAKQTENQFRDQTSILTKPWRQNHASGFQKQERDIVHLSLKTEPIQVLTVSTRRRERRDLVKTGVSLFFLPALPDWQTEHCKQISYLPCKVGILLANTNTNTITNWNFEILIQFWFILIWFKYCAAARLM